MESFCTHFRTALKTRSSGFTLVELMVVLAIIVTISGVILGSQSSFNKTLILSNTAYDIALTLRSAQTYGLGSRASVASANAGYGLHLNSGVQDSFILFSDTSPAASCGAPDCPPGDHVYTNGQDVLVQTYALGNRMAVSNFCAFSSGAWACAANGGLTSLDLVFARPNPDAFMSKNGTYSPVFPVTAACLTISSPQGGSRFISVGTSGQIVANAASCP